MEQHRLTAQMIRYQPPKSQVWGHRVGRLPAERIVRLGLDFLNEQCVVEVDCESGPLSLSWCPMESPAATKAAGVIVARLGPASKVDASSYFGQTRRQMQWQVTLAQLPTVALWFDENGGLLRGDDFLAGLSTFWKFRWREQAADPTRNAGGTFGISLGCPHYLTTMFTFRDMAQYTKIKNYLRTVGLVKLSDKHLRPKGIFGVTDTDRP